MKNNHAMFSFFYFLYTESYAKRINCIDAHIPFTVKKTAATRKNKIKQNNKNI